MFKDQVVWITGASSGIGREMALQFSQSGAIAIVSARRVERLNDVVQQIEALGGKAMAIPCDVADEESVKNAVETIKTKFNRLDVVVANAGFGVGGKIEKLTPANWRLQYDVNVFGVVNTIHYSLPLIKEHKGRIVLMSSIASMISSIRTGPYSSTKAAVRTIGQTLSMELQGTGASCTTLCPGLVDTEIWKVDNQGKFQEELGSKKPSTNLMWPTDKAVRVMLKAIKNRRRSEVITGHGKILAFMGRHFPSLVYWLMTKKLLRGL